MLEFGMNSLTKRAIEQPCIVTKLKSCDQLLVTKKSQVFAKEIQTLNRQTTINIVSWDWNGPKSPLKQSLLSPQELTTLKTCQDSQWKILQNSSCCSRSSSGPCQKSDFLMERLWLWVFLSKVPASIQPNACILVRYLQKTGSLMFPDENDHLWPFETSTKWFWTV